VRVCDVCVLYLGTCVHIQLVIATSIFSHAFHTFRENVLFYVAFSRFRTNTCCPSGVSSAIVLTFYVVRLYPEDPFMMWFIVSCIWNQHDRFRMFCMLVIILVKQWPTCMKELGEFKEWNSYCHYTCSLIVIESLQTSVFFYYRCISVVYDYHFYFVTVTLNLRRLHLCVLMAFSFEYWLLEYDTSTYLEQWLALSVLHLFTFCCPSWQGNLLIFPCSLCLLR
jgi:hypothetical protein